MQSFYASLAVPPQWTNDRGEATPADFADPHAEYQNLLHKAAWVNFSHMGMVALEGSERRTFFSGLTTNQVNRLAADQSLYSALLTPQGRFLWDFTLLEYGTQEQAEQLLLLCEPDRVAELIQQILFYRLRSKISVTDRRQSFYLLGIIGPEAQSHLAALFPELHLHNERLGQTWIPKPGWRLWLDPRHEKFGWRLLLPQEGWSTISKRFAELLPVAGWTAWQQYRVANGLPRGGSEWTPNVTLPLEAGLLELHGVDFSKGCYVGQETTTRTHHRGTLKKRLFRITGPQEISWETPLTVQRADGKEVGQLTSFCPQTGQGLAILYTAEVNHAHGALFIQGKTVMADKPDWAQWE
ncbi:YgfZ/GcvT domain-containing protein [Candidatus Magnetaquicoccus inordinatus]|uniref:CAF17-like 4Fe-4S cluster assembly/insertion protein YgfZ n=1 Tax=Candidatus Magnetaquicoccus inordinatus TaxID=2496818 RepID=UPI00102BDF83|nr:folate-binding protein YgfZ [Candidatus Magnetaquicoccus inordinatus]